MNAEQQPKQRGASKAAETIMMIALCLAVFAAMPFACGACTGLYERGYQAVAP